MSQWWPTRKCHCCRSAPTYACWRATLSSRRWWTPTRPSTARRRAPTRSCSTCWLDGRSTTPDSSAARCWRWTASARGAWPCTSVCTLTGNAPTSPVTNCTRFSCASLTGRSPSDPSTSTDSPSTHKASSSKVRPLVLILIFLYISSYMKLLGYFCQYHQNLIIKKKEFWLRLQIWRGKVDKKCW